MAKSQSKRGNSGGLGPRVGHLDSLAGIMREMACVYREVRTGKTKADLGAKLVFMLRELRACLEAQAMEAMQQRLEALSTAAEQRNGYTQPAIALIPN
jgi:hypothetical protein